MLYSTLAIAAAAFAGIASAQNYTTSGPLNVTASQFPISLRNSWCTGERNNCPKICGGRASENNCDANVLSYSCICQDGSRPNVSDYAETMPFYICEQWKRNCIANHPDDSDGQMGCMLVTCGAKNASAADGGSSSTAAASTGTASTSATGSMTTMTTTSAASTAAATSATSSSSRGAAATAYVIAQNYGTPILAAGMLAAFGLHL